jgi:excisionase family DNA binding protein
MDDNDLMTVAQVAEKLGMGADYVYRTIKANKLRATKLGNTYRIRWADYKAFITPATAPTAAPRSQKDRIKQLLRSELKSLPAVR